MAQLILCMGFRLSVSRLVSQLGRFQQLALSTTQLSTSFSLELTGKVRFLMGSLSKYLRSLNL
uniref:Inositol monophosphatase 1 n=1 Tax=Solanum tuberosum TaxID=4113 RepID=M1C694_SOLTU